MANHRYTLIRDTPDPRDFRAAALEPARVAVLPPKVDLHDCMAVPIPTWDQDGRGSCTGYGGGKAHETRRRLMGLAPREPSFLFIYRQERAKEQTFPADNGAQIRTCAQVMAQLGVPSSAAFSNDPATFNADPTPQALMEAAQFQVDQYHRVDATPAAICGQVASGEPVIFGFEVFESFESAVVAKTGIVPMPAPGEQALGGHCVCVTGYEITTPGGTHGGLFGAVLDRLFGLRPMDGYFLCDNSWGEAWGMKGRFRLPFAFCAKGYVWDCWAIASVEK